ncbi:DUF882 domain-containing protein [Rhizobium halophytocola]|uniref:Murein endopeptidase K n=1 Tax=Rhizobium halophytocola TaxID=735519 RepID=A0ABS4DT80_9HYPH|nr:DUF882 domain-containing protein [Rhizobium halophytocola]MBP1848908.1 uncharacterized protein YcbK (DUF882 family) [Rhizobium halophytocola]
MLCSMAGTASAETRSLKIYFVHTGEKADVVFKRNGRYDAAGLKKLSYLLRDWRRNEPTKMDPRLFDLVWEVYRRSNSSGYINVLSGYRSPQTNAMLRARSRGVAKKSQHMLGTAMDFFIPGTGLKSLREIGMKLQAGGIGYYPNSGSPFVHMDVGGVRAWPRMSRSELVRLFPDGKTLHIPADGKPLPGYKLALADYKKRLANNEIVIAGSSAPSKRKNLFAMLFGGGDEDEEEDVAMPEERPSMVGSAPAVAAPPPGVSAPDPVSVAPPVETAVAAIDAPVPLARPSLTSANGSTSLAVALYSQNESAAEQALNKVAAVDQTPPTGDYPDLQAYKIPVPTLLGPRGMKGDAEPEVLTASLAPDASSATDINGEPVPLPIDRPSIAEKLEAQVDVDAEAESDVDEVQQVILSPEAAQAMATAAKRLSQPPAMPTLAPAAVAAAVREPQPALTAKPAAKPYQVAAIDPPQPLLDRFGDAFDVPETSGQSVKSAEPGKGGRPGEAMRGGKLTKDMLSNWALNNKKFDPESRKAPRVAARTLTAEASYVYAVGFKETHAPVDPARFGKPVND